MLSQQLIFSALEQESKGEVFSIAFDDVWESFGYKTTTQKKAKQNARRYIEESAGLTKVGTPQRVPSSTTKTTELTTYYLDDSNSIHFSVTSYKFALAGARTENGRQYLLYLIDIEHQYRKQLERQLTLTDCDVPGFPHNLHDLWIDSGIVDKRQVRTAVERDFIEKKHYHYEGAEMQVSEVCYKILMLNFRSKRGADISKLGDRLNIPIQELYEYGERKKANTRLAKREQNNGQLKLF